jgi:hypothetical protein
MGVTSKGSGVLYLQFCAVLSMELNSLNPYPDTDLDPAFQVNPDQNTDPVPDPGF